MPIDIFYLCTIIKGDCMGLSFGEKLKNLREDKDLNQTELGTILHMTQRKLSYIETGKCEPSLEDVRRICLFFGISSDYFLGLPNNLSYPK